LNQDSSQSLAQLLWIAYTDICYLLILHIKEGYSLWKVKWLILKNMLHWNAELSQSPSWIIQSQMEEGNSLSEESVITKKIKLGSTQKVKVHDYWEPSCPFLLSNEVDNWIDDTIQFLLTKFLPKLLKQVNS
jgi:hypothetical protein